MSLRKDIGKNIKEIRKRRRITQQELADKLNMNKQNISQIERGVYIPSTLAMIELADALRCTPNEIFLGEAVYKTWGDEHDKHSLEEIEHFINRYTTDMLELQYRKIEKARGITDQKEYEKNELLYMLKNSCSISELKDIHDYLFNKRLTELILKFKIPVIEEAKMNHTISWTLQDKAQRDNDE